MHFPRGPHQGGVAYHNIPLPLQVWREIVQRQTHGSRLRFHNQERGCRPRSSCDADLTAVHENGTPTSFCGVGNECAVLNFTEVAPYVSWRIFLQRSVTTSPPVSPKGVAWKGCQARCLLCSGSRVNIAPLLGRNNGAPAESLVSRLHRGNTMLPPRDLGPKPFLGLP